MRNMVGTKVRRAIVTLTVAGGALFGGAIGIGHAMAATATKTPPATTKPAQTPKKGSTPTHHCTHDGSSQGSGTSTTAFGY